MMKITTPTARAVTCPRARYQQPLLDAEALNKRAIALLRSRQSKEALQCLKQGLGVLREIVRQQSHVSATAEWCSTIFSQPAPAMERNEDVVVSPDGVFVFFNHVMLFGKHETSEGCAAALLYNLALLHHRQAMESSSTVLYRKTLQLYALCQRTSSSDIFQFAVMNNTGHIYSHLYMLSEAHACQNWLVQNRARLIPLLDAADEFVLLEPQRSCAAASA